MIWESQTNSATSWPFTNIDLLDQYCNNIIPIVGITHQGLLFIAGAYEVATEGSEGTFNYIAIKIDYMLPT